MNEERQQVRHLYAGREIDPVEAASIHMALEELRDRPDSYLEVEIADDDSAERIEGNCTAVAAELGLRLHIAVTGTRHVPDERGRPTSEPALLRITVESGRW
jgi:hypothetical protein